MIKFNQDDAKREGDKIGVSWKTVKFDVSDLRQGMDVEREHGVAGAPKLPSGYKSNQQTDVTNGLDDPTIFARIALAHLYESPYYYKALAEMEKCLDNGVIATCGNHTIIILISIIVILIIVIIYVYVNHIKTNSETTAISNV